MYEQREEDGRCRKGKHRRRKKKKRKRKKRVGKPCKAKREKKEQRTRYKKNGGVYTNRASTVAIKMIKKGGGGI